MYVLAFDNSTDNLSAKKNWFQGISYMAEILNNNSENTDVYEALNPQRSICIITFFPFFFVSPLLISLNGSAASTQERTEA